MKFAITFEQDEDGFFVASCPALPGCHSQGRTKEEAITNIIEAIRGYIASMRKSGEPIPNPLELDRLYQQGYMRIPEELATGEPQMSMLGELLDKESW